MDRLPEMSEAEHEHWEAMADVEPETGQVRMWVEERVKRGPVLLLKKHTYTTPSCNKIEGWVCERMPPGTHPFFVPSHRLGRLLTEMEVVAWASK